jgi:hypothetical protein
MPVLITLKGGKGVTLPQTMIANMPNLNAMVATAPEITDLTDNVQKKAVHLPEIAAEEFGSALIVACGGVCKTCDRDVLTALGVVAPQMAPIYSAVENAPIPHRPEHLIYKNDGALLQNFMIEERAAPSERNVFPSTFGMDGTSGHSTEIVNIPGAHIDRNIAFPLACPNTAHLNAMHTFVLKIAFPNLRSVSNEYNATLPPGVVPHANLVWKPDVMDRLFENIVLEIGGHPFEKKSATLNEMVARMHDLWPGLFTCPNSNAQWTATVPVMIFPTVDPTSPLPAVAWKNNGARLILEHVAPLHTLVRRSDTSLQSVEQMAAGAKPLKYELFAEGIMFHDQKYSQSLPPAGLVVADPKGHDVECISCIKQKEEEKEKEKEKEKKTKEEKEEKSAPSGLTVQRDAMDVISGVLAQAEGRGPDGTRRAEGLNITGEMTTRTMQEIFVELDFSEAAMYTQTIHLQDTITGPCCGLFAMFKPTRYIPTNGAKFPIRGASLMINGLLVSNFDCCDLFEWNWLKTGIQRFYPLRTALIPFSRFMNKPGIGATINMKLAQNVSVVFYLNPVMASVGWKVCIFGAIKNPVHFGPDFFASKI